MSYKTISPYDVLTGNQGFMKIDGIEIAELKSLEIKIVPEMKEVTLLNSVTKGKFVTSFSGKITFELNKVYSRFKPTVLEASKNLQLFSFTLEAVVRNVNKTKEERVYISNCWLEDDISIFALNAENDFLTEKFSAGFQIESAEFDDIVDDGKDDWESNSYRTLDTD